MAHPQQAQSEDFRHIVRIVNTDLDGRKPILAAMRKIKGVSFMFSNMILSLTGVDKAIRAGDLSDVQIQKLDEAIRNPLKYGSPLWMLNRRKDYDTGDDKHLSLGDLDFARTSDIKRMQLIRARRGLRHGLKLPVRGQRTKSNFRRNKGKVLGVIKKKEGAPAAAAAPAKDAGKKTPPKKK